jgi:hypothetical protein
MAFPSNILRNFAVSLCHPPRNRNATPIIRVRLEPEPVLDVPDGGGVHKGEKVHR